MIDYKARLDDLIQEACGSWCDSCRDIGTEAVKLADEIHTENKRLVEGILLQANENTGECCNGRTWMQRRLYELVTGVPAAIAGTHGLPESK
ncbi:MAG: hypothetical protein KAS32_19880 [Candidatus Peribacteraceae bacterium]|nr:hypothetical protein [Candidatus Peribacteraceae bacterium]